jgi:hypothetical protein
MANVAQLAAAKGQLPRRTGTPLRELEHLVAINGDDSIGEVEDSDGVLATEGGVSDTGSGGVPDTGSGGGDEPTNPNDDEPRNPVDSEGANANADDEDAINTAGDGADDQERESEGDDGGWPSPGGGESEGTHDDLAEVDADADG